MDNELILAQGTIYQLRAQFGLDNSCGIDYVEHIIMQQNGYNFNLSTSCKNGYYVVTAL